MADVPSTGSGPTTRKVQDGARHPRLARELPGIFDENQVIEILQDCLKLYFGF